MIKGILIILAVIVGLIFVVVAIGLMLPKAHRASRMARFNQPPEIIFAAIIGPQDWRGVTTVELPSNGGTRRWREQSGRNSITFEQAASDPPRLYRSRIADPNLPFSGTWTWEITPTDQGCTCRITEEADVKNPIFRFVGRFVLGYTRSMDAYLTALGRKFNQTVTIEN
jgi:polyketide cyclase/dehydrase/lipid transport protein